MNNELMELVLPRMAKRLNRQLRRYRDGRLNDDQFSRKFETLLQQQFNWLAQQGIPEVEAAYVVHGSVLVLSGPGLRAEAEEQKIPLEIVEFQAVKAAAVDVAENYGVDVGKAMRRISAIVAQYAE